MITIYLIYLDKDVLWKIVILKAYLSGGLDNQLIVRV